MSFNIHLQTGNQAIKCHRELFRDIRPLQRNSNSTYSVEPPMNIYDMGKTYVLLLQIPAVKKEDIKILVTYNLIFIYTEPSINIQYAKDAVGHQELYKEFTLCPSMRTLEIPRAIDCGKTSAEYENGLLKVTLPKSPEAMKVHKVTVV